MAGVHFSECKNKIFDILKTSIAYSFITVTILGELKLSWIHLSRTMVTWGHSVIWNNRGHNLTVFHISVCTFKHYSIRPDTLEQILTYTHGLAIAQRYEV